MEKNPLLKTVIAAIAAASSPGNGYISESELAQKVNISRTRLRETLQTLNAFGIIEKRQKLGVALKPVTIEAVQETYELRELLEGQAIRNALEYVTAPDIAELRELAEAIEVASKMNNMMMAVQYDLKFHHKIIAMSQQPLLKRVLNNLHLIESSFMTGVAVASSSKQWYHGARNPYSHHAIIDALEAHDTKCIELLEKHIAWVKEKELKALAEKLS